MQDILHSTFVELYHAQLNTEEILSESPHFKATSSFIKQRFKQDLDLAGYSLLILIVPGTLKVMHTIVMHWNKIIVDVLTDNGGTSRYNVHLQQYYATIEGKLVTYHAIADLALTEVKRWSAQKFDPHYFLITV
jgi:hypothetical protein